MALTTPDIGAIVTLPVVTDRRDSGVSASLAGKSAAPAVATPALTPQPVTAPQLAEAVKTLNDRYAAQRTDLKFTIDKDSGTTVVAIVDAKDGTVLRQIPSEEALRIAHTLEQNRGALIQRTA
jgi:flagellar protein FlaG